MQGSIRFLPGGGGGGRRFFVSGLMYVFLSKLHRVVHNLSQIAHPSGNISLGNIKIAPRSRVPPSGGGVANSMAPQ